jgi:hypothetical protein
MKRKNKSKYTRKRKMSRYKKKNSKSIRKKKHLKKRHRGGGKTCQRTNIFLRNKLRKSRSWLKAFDNQFQKDVVCKYPTEHFDKFLPDTREKTCGKTERKPTIFYPPDWFTEFTDATRD